MNQIRAVNVLTPPPPPTMSYTHPNTASRGQWQYNASQVVNLTYDLTLRAGTYTLRIICDLVLFFDEIWLIFSLWIFSSGEPCGPPSTESALS